MSKNKLTLNSIKFLVPLKNDSEFYIQIKINNKEIHNSNNLKYSEKISNYKFEKVINLNSANIENIKFLVMIKDTNKEDNNFNCYLKNSCDIDSSFKNVVVDINNNDNAENERSSNLYNNANESVAIVFYNLVYYSDKSFFEYYSNQLRIIEEKENLIFNNESKESEKKNTMDKSSLSFMTKLLTYSDANNLDVMKNFVGNMRYPYYVNKFINDIITWKNYKNTLLFLLILTIFLSTNYFIYCVVILPILMIFIHFCFRNYIYETFCLYNTSFEYKDGIEFILTQMKAFNKFIIFYEDFMSCVNENSHYLFEDLYIEIVKLSLFTYVIFNLSYFATVINIELNFVCICFIWIFVLSNNEKIYLFFSFLSDLISNYYNKYSLFFMIKFVNYFKDIITHFAFRFIPFYSIYKKFEGRKEKLKDSSDLDIVKTISDNLKEISLENRGLIKDPLIYEPLKEQKSPKLLTFEIYENERWWVIISWQKKVLMNEVPLWSDIKQKQYIDKETCILPNSEYSWLSDWEIKITSNSDKDGWEYSNDFNSTFNSDPFGKFVRKRKWVRTAIKKDTVIYS